MKPRTQVLFTDGSWNDNMCFKNIGHRKRGNIKNEKNGDIWVGYESWNGFWKVNHVLKFIDRSSGSWKLAALFMTISTGAVGSFTKLQTVVQIRRDSRLPVLVWRYQWGCVKMIGIHALNFCESTSNSFIKRAVIHTTYFFIDQNISLSCFVHCDGTTAGWSRENSRKYLS